MKNHSVDLIILDIIMDPGIDGLEIYKRILEFRPDQKAIIASGDSEPDRVREAQEDRYPRPILKNPILWKTSGW